MSRWIQDLARLESRRIDNDEKPEAEREALPTDHQLVLLIRVIASMGGYEPVCIRWGGSRLRLDFLTPEPLEISIGGGNEAHGIFPTPRLDRMGDVTTRFFKATIAGDRALLATLVGRFAS